MRVVTRRLRVRAPRTPVDGDVPLVNKLGVKGFLIGMSPPYDRETIEQTMSEVRPRFLELAR